MNRLQYRHAGFRFKQLGHANFIQDLINKVKPQPKKETTPTNNQNTPKKFPKTFKFHPDTGKPLTPDELEGDEPNKSQNSPLDNFAGLFHTTPNGDDAPPSFSLDPAKLQEVAGKLNFLGQLSDEDQEILKSGDITKITPLLNRMGQNSYLTIMQHLPQLTEVYVNKRVEHATKGLGSQVKSTLTKQSLAKLAADNPVLKEQLDRVSDGLLTKFPDADPDWIAEQSVMFFTEMARTLNPDAFKGAGDKTNPTDSRDLSQKPGFNWGNYVTGKDPNK